MPGVDDLSLLLQGQTIAPRNESGRDRHRSLVAAKVGQAIKRSLIEQARVPPHTISFLTTDLVQARQGTGGTPEGEIHVAFELMFVEKRLRNPHQLRIRVDSSAAFAQKLAKRHGPAG